MCRNLFFKNQPIRRTKTQKKNDSTQQLLRLAWRRISKALNIPKTMSRELNNKHNTNKYIYISYINRKSAEKTQCFRADLTFAFCLLINGGQCIQLMVIGWRVVCGSRRCRCRHRSRCSRRILWLTHRGRDTRAHIHTFLFSAVTEKSVPKISARAILQCCRDFFLPLFALYRMILFSLSLFVNAPKLLIPINPINSLIIRSGTRCGVFKCYRWTQSAPLESHSRHWIIFPNWIQIRDSRTRDLYLRNHKRERWKKILESSVPREHAPRFSLYCKRKNCRWSSDLALPTGDTITRRPL